LTTDHTDDTDASWRKTALPPSFKIHGISEIRGFSSILRVFGDPSRKILTGGCASAMIKNAGAQLTADHIVQSALVIGRDAMHPAVVTIAPSGPSGNPVAALSSFLAESGLTGAGAQSPNSSPAPLPSVSTLLSTGSTGHPSGETSVPEPSALVLVAMGIAGAVASQCCRRSFQP
jgi:hypothetical protein